MEHFLLQSINGCEYLVITPDRNLVFPSVEYVRTLINKQGAKQGTEVPVVIDSTYIQVADFTAAKVCLKIPVIQLLLTQINLSIICFCYEF